MAEQTNQLQTTAGGQTVTVPTNPPTTTPTEQAQAQPANVTGTNDGQTPAPEKQFTQADVDRIVKERLDREKAKAEKDAQKLKEEAERQALEKNQEWKALAEKHQAKITQLETQVSELEAMRQRAERYAQALEAQVTAQTATLPQHINALLTKLDPVEKLEWLTANAQALGRQNGVVIPATPRPAGQGAMDEQRRRDASEEQRRYTAQRF